MFSDPNAIIAQLHIQPGSSVADLGAGVGSFSFPLAKSVGPNGKVYACDVQSDMLTRIENEARAQGITNIQTVHSNVETHQGTKLRDQSVDWVIAANVLFQVEDRPAFLAEIARILKSGGNALIVDWTESFGNLGPHAKDVVSQSEATQLATAVGLQAAPAALRAGDHHYAIILKK
jgi:ubiquinone/menaquinone biosynthesis C-methylase UbiE